VLAAPAIAAYVCHPDPAGTRSLSLKGRVLAYSLRGSTLHIALESRAGCNVLAWHVGDGRVAPIGRACASVAVGHRSEPTRVKIVTGSVDTPDRIEVHGPGGRVARSWPLAVRARLGTLQVAGGLAAFLVRGRPGLWVVRLSDGRATFVAPVTRGDTPRLAAAGVAYQDDVYKRRPADRPLLKFVPTHGVERELAQVVRPLHTGGPIRSISADGTRVALAVGGARCDRVVFWDIAWRSAEQVSEKRGPTCGTLGSSSPISRNVSAGARAESGRISTVVLAGARAEWVTLHRGRPMLVAADDIGCVEWVVRRLSDLPSAWSFAALAGNGPTLAYALRSGSSRSQVARVGGDYRARFLFDVRGRVRAVAADGWRTAVLIRDGTIAVRRYGGRTYRLLQAPGATAIALRGNRLVATTRDSLDVYSVPAARLVHRWPLPRGAGKVDVQYGTAVVTAGRSVYAIDTATGRTTRLALAPAAVQAQIEPIGVVYAYSSGGRGTAVLVPMSRVEQSVRPHLTP
jgi:hypothetical protein